MAHAAKIRLPNSNIKICILPSFWSKIYKFAPKIEWDFTALLQNALQTLISREAFRKIICSMV